MDISKQNKRKVFLDESYKAQREYMQASNYNQEPTEFWKEIEDEKWRYYELRGKYGMIYPYSSDQLAVCFTSKTVSNKILKQKRNGWVLKLDCKDETVFWFPHDDIEFVANIIKAWRKRPRLSNKAREKLINVGQNTRLDKK